MPARPSDKGIMKVRTLVWKAVKAGDSRRLTLYFLICLLSHQIVNNKFSQMTLDGREAVGEKQRKKDENR
jgi:hypothetical protein